MHDADVIKYLCLSFSRFVLDSALYFEFNRIELRVFVMINHALDGCKMAEKIIQTRKQTPSEGN